MARRRRSSAVPSSNLPIAVSNGINNQIRRITQRLIDNLPQPRFTPLELDCMVAKAEEVHFLRKLAARNTGRIHITNNIQVALMEPGNAEHESWLAALKAGSGRGTLAPGMRTLHLNMHYDNNYGSDHNVTEDQLRHAFVYPRPTTNLVPVFATPEQLDALRAYATERYTTGLHVAVARKLVEVVLERCTTVAQIKRVWPQLLDWASGDSDIREAASKLGNSRGRIPELWNEDLDRFIPAVDYLLGRASLLADKPATKGDYVTRAHLIHPEGQRPRLTWDKTTLIDPA